LFRHDPKIRVTVAISRIASSTAARVGQHSTKNGSGTVLRAIRRSWWPPGGHGEGHCPEAWAHLRLGTLHQVDPACALQVARPSQTTVRQGPQSGVGQ
jgi:hypothetical protein